jgi:putative heme degradation protein
MATRDRVALTTPQGRTTLKGWSIENVIHINLSTRKVEMSIRFYDSAGAYVKSINVTGNISVAQRNNVLTNLEGDVITQFPELAGIATLETVADVDDPVINP